MTAPAPAHSASRHITLSALFAGAAIVFAAALPGAAEAEETVVEVRHESLTPPMVTISPDETVVFVNKVRMPGGHRLVADDGSFESPPLKKGDRWSHTFSEPGTHKYRVIEHSSNTGVIIVKGDDGG